MSEQDLISKYRKANENSKIADEKWDCDIYSILCDLIHEYNETLNYDPGPAFRNVKKTKQRLKDLLKQDSEYLIYYNPQLAALKDNVYIEEALQELPGASVFNSNNFKEYLLLFNTPLLNFIHSFNANFDVITQPNYLNGYLKKYHRIAQSNAFSDMTVMGNIMVDVMDFYVGHKLHAATHLYFYREPYNVCERVKATRRFILAHEFAHILLNHHKEALAKRRLTNGLDFLLFKKDQEYEADALALEMVLKKFDKRNLSDNEYYELINAINGIRLYFILLGFVESFHEWYKITSDYPHSTFREMAIFDRASEWLVSRKLKDIELLHKCIKSLENFTATKNSFLDLPHDIPTRQYGAAVFDALYAVETKTAEEIRYAIHDSNYAEFLIRYRGYASFYDMYRIYNVGLFKTITERELEIYFRYHALQFGPEYAGNKIAYEFNRVIRHTETSSSYSWLENHQEERKMLVLKRLQNSSGGKFNERFEERYWHCWNSSLEKLKEFHKLNAN